MRHFHYEILGQYLDATRNELKIPIQTLCEESHIGPSTYYKIKEGEDHDLNIYARFMNCLSGYCDKETFDRLKYEFFSITCAEVHHKLGEETPAEVEWIYEKNRLKNL